VATGGYGVSRIKICNDSPILNKNIKEADLPKSNILILAVERDGNITPNPSPDTQVMLGDSLICFGKFIDIRRKVCLEPQDNV
jgi:Trk K+ transport system NAD-binding subunit